MRTRDIDEAVEAVTKVFCPHTIEVMGNSPVDARLAVRPALLQPVAELSYGAPVRIDSRVARLLIMHCARGSASAQQEGRSGDWRKGQTLPLSAGFDTQIRLDEAALQHVTLLDMEQVEAHCARWLGRPLEQPLRFSLEPFSDELERVWLNTVAYLSANEGSPIASSAPVKAAFDEFLFTLLLHHHPHNFNEALNENAPSPVPGLVRRAERFMADNVEAPITVSDVARHLGVSLRTLQAGFRNWRNSTPSLHLRQIRLQRAREELLMSDGDVSVTIVALQNGFSHLGRFSAYYHAAFGETPSVTLRRRCSGRPG